MSEQPDTESPQIAEAHAQLKRGLKLCHSVIDDYRLKLAANANEAEAANDEDEDETRLG